jgi:hypothetical protein
MPTMKHWIACFSLGLFLITTGCDTVNHSQLRIAPPRSARRVQLTIPATERQRVKQVLTDIALKHRLEDRTELSLIPDTVASFSEVDKKNPIRFVAWVKDNHIYIDLFQRPPEAGETEAYRQLREEIISELDNHFGARLKQVPKIDQVTSKAANP